MAIISQDAIKLGCSGSQGKIQIQTFFEHAAQLVQQIRLRRTSVENPRQRRVNLYKLVCLWRDRPYFMQNKANFRKSQMDVSLIITKNYEKKSNRTLGENKPKTKPILRLRSGRDKANAGSLGNLKYRNLYFSDGIYRIEKRLNKKKSC